jgi:hypothetical protein
MRRAKACKHCESKSRRTCKPASTASNVNTVQGRVRGLDPKYWGGSDWSRAAWTMELGRYSPAIKTETRKYRNIFSMISVHLFKLLKFLRGQDLASRRNVSHSCKTAIPQLLPERENQSGYKQCFDIHTWTMKELEAFAVMRRAAHVLFLL